MAHRDFTLWLSIPSTCTAFDWVFHVPAIHLTCYPKYLWLGTLCSTFDWLHTYISVSALPTLCKPSSPLWLSGEYWVVSSWAVSTTQWAGLDIPCREDQYATHSHPSSVFTSSLSLSLSSSMSLSLSLFVCTHACRYVIDNMVYKDWLWSWFGSVVCGQHGMVGAVWGMMGYGVSLRSCGQFSPHLLVPSLHVVCYRGPVPLLDLDALCVKEGGRNWGKFSNHTIGFTYLCERYWKQQGHETKCVLVAWC